jgi:hydroxymethylbilane synthase
MLAVTATRKLKIGTRGSDLALYQAHFTSDLIGSKLDHSCELVILKTQGDKDQSRPVTELGGVGVFVKELERALLASDVDLAVHSLKDLPTDLPDGLVVACYPIRVSPHELLIVNPAALDRSRGLLPLKEGAKVGTASLRRRAQLLELRPDLTVVPIRGNVPRRVDLARGDVDAVVLAAAGVDRLELDLGDLVRVDLPLDDFLPAPGQGALALEIRGDDAQLLELLGRLDDANARLTTEAERLLLHGLGVGCSVPLGTHAILDGEQIILRSIFEVGSTADGHPHMGHAVTRGSSPKAVADLALRCLRGLSAPTVETDGSPLKGKRVLIARNAARAAPVVNALTAAGAEVSCRRPTRREPVGDAEEARAALQALPADGWILFASLNAIQELDARTSSLVDAIAGRRTGAVGPGTADALARTHVPLDLLAEQATSAGLADAFLAMVGDARPAVLLPAARGGRTELSDALRDAGCAVTVLELYESVPGPAPAAGELACDVLVLASPSGARATLAGDSVTTALESCKLVAYGPTTAAAIESLGFTVAATAKEPTTGGVLDAVIEASSQ